VTAAPGGDVAGPAGAATVPVAPLEAGARVAIVASRYHGDIVQRLVDGAFAELGERGVEERRVTLALVPGAFELPVVAKTLAAQGRFVAVVCLGCVIRGQTPHFEYVCAEAARGITLASLETGVPISFGVITADTYEQAVARAGGEVGNKGAEAVAAALEVAAVLAGARAT
jgi:6,7-dimethyl-8-ribityllumazine synthase